MMMKRGSPSDEAHAGGRVILALDILCDENANLRPSLCICADSEGFRELAREMNRMSDLMTRKQGVGPDFHAHVQSPLIDEELSHGMEIKLIPIDTDSVESVVRRHGIEVSSLATANAKHLARSLADLIEKASISLNAQDVKERP